MDRMVPSEGTDVGSIPAERTKSKRRPKVGRRQTRACAGSIFFLLLRALGRPNDLVIRKLLFDEPTKVQIAPGGAIWFFFA